MRYSYSKVGCYTTCPRQFKYRYIDRYDTIPDQSPDNALYLGLGLHKGIETTVEDGIKEYLSHYYCVSDENYNWVMQLEYQIQRVKEVVPHGFNEVEIKTDYFIGYIDRLVPTYIEDGLQHYDIYDYKFSNNVDRYMESGQLSIYKEYFEASHPNCVVDNLHFVFVPKLLIRQKKTETLQTFRTRLMSELEKTRVVVKRVEYSSQKADEYRSEILKIEDDTVYEPNPTRLCDWCAYRGLCKDNDYTDIIEKEKEA